MKSIWWKILVLTIAVSVSITLYFHFKPNSVIPPSITKQLTSSLLIPSEETIIDKDSFDYNAADKMLSFTGTYVGKPLIISEQPTPESFVDIPQSYDKVVQSMNNYNSFESNLGTVHLTRPTNLKTKQVAVLNAKGTLMFVRADTDLSNDEWRRFFLNMKIQN